MDQLAEEEKKTNTVKQQEEDYFKYAMNVIRSNTDKFKVKRRTEFENLLKRPVYSKATVRIKFPDESIIQANFAMKETVSEIYDFVRENLNDISERFTLFTPFPSKKYVNMSRTVYAEGFAPSVLLYVTLENVDPRVNRDYKYLSDSSVERYKTEYRLDK